MRKQVLLILCCVLCIGEVSAQFNKVGYYRVRNSITNNCICVIGDKYRTSTNPDAFDQSIRLKPVADCYSDPASVIYINASISEAKLKNATLKAQGTDTYEISGMYLDIVKSGDFYIPEAHFIFTMYAQEYPTGWLDVGQGDTYAKYYLDPLDYTNNTTKRDECYFGAKCAEKMENGGKYYTSMYTSFPYECIDGVNAYYVDGIENGIVHCVPVPNNKVPSNTGVILECNTPNDPAHNRLIPLLNEPAKISGNLLKGVFFNYDGTGYDGATRTPNRTAYDKNTMRVFSVSKTTGKIGFYQYSGSYLGANKAYLEYDFSNAHSNSFDGELTMNFDNTMSGVNEVHVDVLEQSELVPIALKGAGGIEFDGMPSGELAISVLEDRANAEVGSISEFWDSFLNEKKELELNCVVRIRNENNEIFKIPPEIVRPPLKVKGGGAIVLEQGSAEFGGVECDTLKEALTVAVKGSGNVRFNSISQNQVNIIAPGCELSYSARIDMLGSLCVRSISVDDRFQGGRIIFRQGTDPVQRLSNAFYKIYLSPRDSYWNG